MSKFLLALLVAWLGWRLWRGSAPRRPASLPGENQYSAARALLGVGKDAGEAEIRAAHRRLVTEAHPDRGGSTETTRQLNAARDLLLR